MFKIVVNNWQEMKIAVIFYIKKLHIPVSRGGTNILILYFCKSKYTNCNRIYTRWSKFLNFIYRFIILTAFVIFKVKVKILSLWVTCE